MCVCEGGRVCVIYIYIYIPRVYFTVINMESFLSIRFGVEYKGQAMNNYGFHRGERSVTCNMADDERITAVTICKGLSSSNYKIFPGIQFITNQKSCPLFGSMTSDCVNVSGHRLLFISAKQGVKILKKITLHFDHGCQTN